MKLLSVYISKIYLKNFLKIFVIFLIIFTIIDFASSFTQDFDTFVIIFFNVIYNIENLLSIVFFITTFTTVLKLKKTKQDVSFLIANYTYNQVFNIFIIITMVIYIVYISIFSSIGYFVMKNPEKINQNRKDNTICIKNILSKKLYKNGIYITNIEYDSCQKKILNKITNNFNLENNEIEIFKEDFNSNRLMDIKYFSINNTFSINKISNNAEDLETSSIDEIDIYKKDILQEDIPIYYALKMYIIDSVNEIDFSYIKNIIFNKIRNLLLSVIYVYINIYLYSSNIRSKDFSKKIAKMFVFIYIYYSLSYVLYEKSKYTNSIFMQIIINIVTHALLLYILYNIHYFNRYIKKKLKFIN